MGVSVLGVGRFGVGSRRETAGWLGVGYLSVGHLGVSVLGVGRLGVGSRRPAQTRAARTDRSGLTLSFLELVVSPRRVDLSDSVFAPVGFVLCRSPSFSRAPKRPAISTA